MSSRVNPAAVRPLINHVPCQYSSRKNSLYISPMRSVGALAIAGDTMLAAAWV